MTDNADNTPEQEPVAAAPLTAEERQARRQRGRNNVVDYVDADPELKAEMEKLMEEIDLNPEGFASILNYGQAPLAELGAVATEMMAVQTRFNNQVNVMAGAMDKLQQGLKGMSFDKFAESTGNLLKSLADAGVKTVGGGFNLGKKLAKAFGKSSRPKTEDEKLLADMQEALPVMLNEMVSLVDSVDQTGEGIREVWTEAEKLGKARVKATRELNKYLGAGKEVLRRYEEEYIPQAQKLWDESGDPEDKLLYDNMLKRREDFIHRLSFLEGSRLQSIISAQQLKQIMDTIETQLKQIDTIKNSGQNEWKAMLVTAGIAGSALKAAQTIARSNEFGNKIHRSTDQMLDQAHQLTLDANGQSTVTTENLLESARKIGKRLEAETLARAAMLKKLEAEGTTLRGAADKLLESVQASDDKRTLDAAPESSKTKANDNNGTTTRQSRAERLAGPKS